MITKFRVENYKALRDVSLDLTPMHVLIGPNDSGKTSILEAIMALCRSVDHTLADAFVGQWSGRSLVSSASDQNTISLSATLDADDQELTYSLSCTFPQEGREVRQDTERVTQPDDAWDFDLTNSAWSNVFQLAVRKSFHHSDSHANSQESQARLGLAQRIHDALQGVQFFHFNPSILALPTSADSNRRYRMEPNGFGLALCLDNILGHERAAFDQLEAAFRRIFPQIRSIKLKPQQGHKAPVDDPRLSPELSRGDGKGLYFAFDNGKGDVAAEQMSDGVLLVLAYLTVLYSPEPPRVLLVEEPENGIHPHRLKDVLGILRDLVSAQDYTQVVLTTHSPYVVDLFEPNEVTVCWRTDDDRIATKRCADSQAVREQMKVFTLGEIWASEGEEAIAK